MRSRRDWLELRSKIHLRKETGKQAKTRRRKKEFGKPPLVVSLVASVTGRGIKVGLLQLVLVVSDQGGDVILQFGGLGVDGGGLLVLQGRGDVTSIGDVDGHLGCLPNLLGRVVVHRLLQAFLQRRKRR